jgi:hypothetical protein
MSRKWLFERIGVAVDATIGRLAPYIFGAAVLLLVLMLSAIPPLLTAWLALTIGLAWLLVKEKKILNRPETR